MTFIPFQYTALWGGSCRASFLGIWFFKFISYENDIEKNRSLFFFASAEGQLVLDIFWFRVIGYIPND